MDESLEPDAVDENAEPDELVDGLLDLKGYLLPLPEGVEVYIYEGEEYVFSLQISGYNWDQLYRYHPHHKHQQGELMLEKFENPSSTPAWVDFVSVHQSQRAEEVYEI